MRYDVKCSAIHSELVPHLLLNHNHCVAIKTVTMTASAHQKVIYEKACNSKMLKQMLPSMVSAAKYKSMPHNPVCYQHVYELHVSCFAPHIGISVTVKWPLQ